MTLALATAFPFAASAASAEWQPKNPIKILVPYSAGGAADLATRAVAPEMSKRLGVPVVVENATGGAGAIGMAKLASSKPDGYTLIYTSMGAATLTPIRSNVGYTNKEFTPLAQMVNMPCYIVVHKDSGIKSLPELLAKAEKGETVTYGTAGAGLIQNTHMEAMLLAIKKPGLLVHVPFNGGSQAVAALLGKQIDAAMCVMPEILPQVKNGTFVALATSYAERDPALPDVPAFPELGYPGYGGGWQGFAAPANMPAPIVERLDSVLKEISGLPEVIDVFTKLGNPIRFIGHKEFTEQWMRDYETNKEVIAELLKHQKK